MTYLDDEDDEILTPAEERARLTRRPFDEGAVRDVPNMVPGDLRRIISRPKETAMAVPPDAPMPDAPTPELRNLIGRSGGPVNPRQSDYEQKQAKVASVVGERPVEGPPKWWQRVAAGAAGGLAGLTNASGRSQVDPSAAVDTIYGGPEKRQRLSDWKGRVEGAEKQAEAAKGTLDQWRRGQTQDRQDDLADAQIEHYRSQVERERAVAAKKPAPRVEKSGDDVYEQQPDGSWKKVINGTAKAPATLEQIKASIVSDPNLTEDQVKAKLARVGYADKPAAPPAQNRDHWIATVNNPEASQPAKDAAKANLDEDDRRTRANRPPAGGAFGSSGGSPDDPKVIAQAIMSGRQPPVLTGLYGKASAVKAELERNKFDQSTALSDWAAVQRHITTLNGPQQERLRQAVNFTYDSLDQIDALYDEWKKVAGVSGLKILNRGNLAVSKQLGGKAGEVATSLEAQLNDLTSELGTVYKGGSGSTDESLRLAGENLKADWNEATFKRALGQIRKNLQIRRNSINNSQPAGVSENSQYGPKGGSAGQPTTPTAAPAAGGVIKWTRDAKGNPIPVKR